MITNLFKKNEKVSEASFNNIEPIEGRISIIGNCQAEALGWYIRRLPQMIKAREDKVASCNFLVAENFSEHMKKIYGEEEYQKKLFLDTNKKNRHKLVRNDRKEYKHNIHDSMRIKKMIQHSDVIIFQKIRTETAPNLNYGRVKLLAKDEAELISISSFHYKEGKVRFERKMAAKDKELGVRIKGSELIKDREGINSVDQPNHPNYKYFLELVSDICDIMGWEYYSDDQLKYFEETKFPFG